MARRAGLIGLAGTAAAMLWSRLGLPPAAAQNSLRDGGTGRVRAVIDGDTVELADGREVRLVGIQAPKLPLGRRGFGTWPLAPEARRHLVRMIEDEAVSLRHGGVDMDRHGRVLAHLYRESDGAWVQGQMLRDGFARVYTFPDNRALVDEMLAEETVARSEKRGIWALDHYRIRQADAVDLRDDYALVEGVVRDTARVRRVIYLNFGTDWRSDFTATIDTGERRRFVAAGRDPEALLGQRVRLRGWVRERNGPMIALTHPEQIEILEPRRS